MLNKQENEIKSIVNFEVKYNVLSDQDITFSTIDKKIAINIQGTNCKLVVEGKNEQNNLEYIILIWELLVWEDGYFYKPKSYTVNGAERNLKSLLSIDCRITDLKWVKNTVLLCENRRVINEEIIEKYRNIRYLDRRQQSMNAAMFSSYFYLLSESYANINIEHRLVLLMHICDGVAMQFCNGNPKNNVGNIHAILNELKTKKYKHGVYLQGIDSKNVKNAIGETRNELTHYQYKPNSLGSYIDNPDTNTDRMVNLYIFFVLTVALRVAVLEAIGVNVSNDIKESAMDEYLDWIRLESNSDEECTLAKYKLFQLLKKCNNT